jgi:hypothetical protein
MASRGKAIPLGDPYSRHVTGLSALPGERKFRCDPPSTLLRARRCSALVPNPRAFVQAGDQTSEITYSGLCQSAHIHRGVRSSACPELTN